MSRTDINRNTQIRLCDNLCSRFVVQKVELGREFEVENEMRNEDFRRSLSEFLA
jgi:hypothetical protein